MVVFEGRADGCRFVTLSEGEAQIGGLILTEIGLEQSPGVMALTLWTTPYRAESVWTVVRDKMRATRIVASASLLEFSYFGSDGYDKPPHWSRSWSNQNQLPQLVSVRIGAASSNGRNVSPVTVALRQR